MIKAVTTIRSSAQQLVRNRSRGFLFNARRRHPAGKCFVAYCAVCHGTAGKGDGPVANALTKRPVDLTQLSRNNGGTFPEVRLMGYISGEETVVAHGNRDMPIWGELFRSLDPNSRELSDLRVHNLAEYIKALQAK